MSTITLPNIRVGSDLQVRVRLKDGGVAIDWSTLQNIKACIYSDAQRALAGRCAFSIDEEDNTLLVCTYAANKPQYLGVNRIVISAKYMGETKTYDKPAFSFVRWTADQEGEEITIDDPDVDVEIDVEDISSSILQEAVDAAFTAADRANDAAAAAEHMVDIHTGPEGKSAYEVAVEEGYTGTEEEWLASLKGDTGETPDISIGTVTTVAPGTPASASMTGTPEEPVLNLSIPQGVVGATPNFTVGTVTTGEPGSSVIVTITGTPEAPVLNVTIPQGMQGNTGSSVDYPYELVNNLTTNDSTKGLSAAQGVVLDGKVSQLEAKVDGYNLGNYVWLNGKGINPTTGAIQNNSDTIASEFYFPVPQGNSYVRFSDNDTTDGNVLQYNIGFYDSNKDILSRSTYGTKTKWDIPVNTAYIRVVLALYNQSGSSIGGDQDDYNLGKIELFFENSVPDRIVSVLEKTEEDIGKSEERVFGDTSFSKAGYINPSTGVLTSGGAWMSTDFIPIAAGDSAEIVNFGTGTVVAAFYNKDKTFISSIAGGAKDKRTVTAPTNACYLRSSNNPSNCEYPYVKVLAIVYEQVAKTLNKEAPSVVLKDDVTLLGANAVKGSAIYRIIGYDFPNEGFINQYGTDSASSAWARTNYIPVVEGDKVSVKIYGVRDLICGLCFYDKDKQPLTKYVPSVDGWYQNSVVIPSGVFYVRSCCTAVYTTSDQGVYLFIIGANEKEIINRHSEELEKTGYDNFVDYPFSFNGKNAAFFGDSITVGYASNPLEIITECYRKILCDKTGLTGLNYAVAGSCVCDEDDAEYMSIRQKITTIVTNESNFDFVFVMGGTNDYWTGKPLGTLADNTNDTFYGSLKTICSHLKANLPSTTPVIFLTPINCSRQDVSAAVASVEDYRKAIFTIATQNGYNVIDTAFVGFPVKYEDTDLRTAIIADGVHPTILGHKMLASAIYRKLK